MVPPEVGAMLLPLVGDDQDTVDYIVATLEDATSTEEYTEIIEAYVEEADDPARTLSDMLALLGVDGEDEGAGARDDEHGEGEEERPDEVAIRTDRPPHHAPRWRENTSGAQSIPRHERHDGTRHNERCKERRDGVGEDLHRCFRGLRLLNELDDLRQRRVLPHARHAHVDGAICVDR